MLPPALQASTVIDQQVPLTSKAMGEEQYSGPSETAASVSCPVKAPPIRQVA